jgi:hypothetical protein
MTLRSPKREGLASPVTTPGSSPTALMSRTSVAASAARETRTTAATARSRSSSSGPTTRVTAGGDEAAGGIATHATRPG